MASNKWSSLYRMTAARRTRLPCGFSNHNHLLRSFWAAIDYNFCTIVPWGTSNSFCTITNNSSPPQLQQEQRCTNNSSSVAAEAEFESSSPGPGLYSLPPVLMLPSSEVFEEEVEEEDDNYYEGFFSLKNHRIMKLRKYILPDFIIDADCKGSSKGVLAFVNRQDCRMYLAELLYPGNPYFIDFPSILSLPRFKETIPTPEDSSSSAKHISEYKYKADDGNVTETSPTQVRSLLIRRLALSSEYILERDCIVMISQGDGQGLAFSRRHDPAWTPLPGSPTLVEDVFYSSNDKRFYSIVGKDGEIQAWDFNYADDNGFPKRIDFDFDIRYSDFHYPNFFYEQVQNNLYCTKYYLVESPEGEILFLARYSVSIGQDGSFVNADDFPNDVHLPIKTAFFAAFKLDFEKRVGVPVKSLGDTVLFVGVNESFSLSTRDHSDLMANSIYFSDDKEDRIYDNFYPYGGDDIGVYNFENYSVTPLYYPSQFKKIRPPPIWVVGPRQWSWEKP